MIIHGPARISVTKIAISLGTKDSVASLICVAAWKMLMIRPVASAAKNSGERPALPVRDLARFVVAGLDGLILQHLSDPDVRRSRKQVRHLVRAGVQLAGLSDHRRKPVHG